MIDNTAVREAQIRRMNETKVSFSLCAFIISISAKLSLRILLFLSPSAEETRRQPSEGRPRGAY